MTALFRVSRIKEVEIADAGMRADVAEAVTSAQVSMSTSQNTQLTLHIEDPRLKLLGDDLIRVGVRARWRDLDLSVAAVETAAGAGQGEIIVKLRSRHVRRLKDRQGRLVMRNVSPTDFVRREADWAGLTVVAQPTERRDQVARDYEDDDEEAAASEPPSSWTTFRRLAREEGFVLFEAAGVLYFAKPSWLKERGADNPVSAHYLTTDEERRTMGVPACRRSIDDPGHVETTVELPYTRVDELRPGYTLTLLQVPTFEGRYLIDDVSFDLASAEHVTVRAATPDDPEPRPPEQDVDHDESGEPAPSTSGGEQTSRSSGAGSGWRWPMRGRISSRFGDRRPGGRSHAGLDIAAPTGTPIVAAKPGVVTHAGSAGGYGLAVYISHGGGVSSRYAHMSRVAVSNGRRVAAGQTIGYCGSTGQSTGPHLHFEIRHGRNAQNPTRFLP